MHLHVQNVYNVMCLLNMSSEHFNVNWYDITGTQAESAFVWVGNEAGSR